MHTLFLENALADRPVLRVTSALWISAYVRRCYADGAFATVARRGAEEAGAILVVIDRLDGTCDVYGPAPQTAFVDAAVVVERRFLPLLERAPPDAVRTRLDREVNFDPDVWIVDVEDRGGLCRLDLIEGR